MLVSPRVALWGSTIVSILVIMGAGFISFLLFKFEIPEKNREIAVAILGGFAPLVGIVVKSWMDLLIHIYNSPTTVVSQQSGTQKVEQ